MLLTGFLAPCEKDPTAWCLGDAQLDFGENADLSQPQQDYDADGGVEPVADELAGLSGTRARVQIDETSHLVLKVQGLPYTVIEAAGPTNPPQTDPAPTDPTATDATADDTATAEPNPSDQPSSTQPTG
jgi:hypothetical protein